jgi:hypothetical protein
MSSTVIANDTINLSQHDRSNIYNYQRWALVTITLSAVFLFMLMKINSSGLTASPYFYGTLGVVFMYVTMFSAVFFIFGFLLHGPRQSVLLSEFWKRQFVVTSTLSKNIMQTSAWALPTILVSMKLVTYPELGDGHIAFAIALTLALIFARLKLTHYRHVAIAQHTLETAD